jgi:hypothetical protein
MSDRPVPETGEPQADVLGLHERRSQDAATDLGVPQGDEPVTGDDCICGYEGPDRFGNYDLIENLDCPLHGPALCPRCGWERGTKDGCCNLGTTTEETVGL